MAPAAVRIWRLWIVMGQQAFEIGRTLLFDHEVFSIMLNYLQDENALLLGRRGFGACFLYAAAYPEFVR